MEDLERYRGSLLGLAVGDSIGTSVEFSPPGTFPPVTDMVGGGVFNLNPGEWTDDTSMALCLGISLIEHEFSAADQLHKYLKWYKIGYMSSNGRCFDIGNTTRRALDHYDKTGKLYCDKLEQDQYSGNGSLMRLAPVALYFQDGLIGMDNVIELCAASSKTTHPAIKCIDSCKVMGYLISKCFYEKDKEKLLNFKSDIHLFKDLDSEVKDVIDGSYKIKNPPDIEASGYVVKTLESALWAFWNSSSFEEGLLKAVNLGDDADTVGAIYGQLAGCFYGENGIPTVWRNRLAKLDLIIEVAEKLHSMPFYGKVEDHIIEDI